MIVKTLESRPPDGGSVWSTRQMAAVTGLNHTAVSWIWRAAPHRHDTWKLLSSVASSNASLASASSR